eukprot:jgi/Mesvir1/15218/Mv06448-RA.1
MWQVFLALLFWTPLHAEVTHAALADCTPWGRSLSNIETKLSEDSFPKCPAKKHGCCTNDWDQLLFLHIPKSGGTALYYALRDTFHANRGSDKGDVRACINRATAHTKNELDLDPMCRSQEAVSRTVCMINEVFPKHCRFLRLHFDFSIVTQILAANTKKKLGLMTIMRQPADRVNSAYRYAKVRAGVIGDFVHGTAGVKENHFGGANHATKQMAGVLNECSQLGDEDRKWLLAHETEMLHLAKQNLRKFCVVIYEYLDESLEYLQAVYGLPNIVLRASKFNAGNRRSIPIDDHKMIMEANHLDAQLYNYSLTLFAQRYHAATGKQLPPYPFRSADVAAFSPYNVRVTEGQ